MRKRVIQGDETPLDTRLDTGEWLDLEELAQVEVTSEDPAYPVEGALLLGRQGGWRAAGPGKQRIRLLFDAPQTLRRIYLHVQEEELERTQEFVLRFAQSGDLPSDPPGDLRREIVRQRYTFSPAGARREVEDYEVQLEGVTVLELTLIPDVSGGRARASLAALRLT